MSDDLYKQPEILRLGKLDPQDRRVINKLQKQGAHPGYIAGWIIADRDLRPKERKSRAKTKEKASE